MKSDDANPTIFKADDSTESDGRKRLHYALDGPKISDVPLLSQAPITKTIHGPHAEGDAQAITSALMCELSIAQASRSNWRGVALVLSVMLAGAIAVCILILTHP